MKSLPRWVNIVAAIVCVLIFAYCAYAEESCVPVSEVVKAWEEAFSRIDAPAGLYITTTECDPCKCPVGGMSSCYEYMAEQERVFEQWYENATKLLNRAKEHGICDTN